MIAGQGPEREALESLSADLGVTDAVRFVGFVDDVRPLFAAADVLVQASTLEGVPQTVVQAIAAGVPAIATEVDGVQEVTDEPCVSILAPDGRGLAETVSARLAATAVPPAPREVVARWLPETVDVHLSNLHDWMEARTDRRQPTPAAGELVPGRLPVTLPTREPATR